MAAARPRPLRTAAVLALGGLLLAATGDTADWPRAVTVCLDLTALPAGPSTGTLGLRVDAPPTVVSGREVRARVLLRSLTGTSLEWHGETPGLVLAHGSEVVALDQGVYIPRYVTAAVPATGEAEIEAPRPTSLPVEGCSNAPIDPACPERPRPLPPGDYDLVAVLPDREEEHDGYLRSAPVRVRVVAAAIPASAAAAAGETRCRGA